MATERDELIDELKRQSLDLGRRRDWYLEEIRHYEQRERELLKEQNDVVDRMNSLMTERMRERERRSK